MAITTWTSEGMDWSDMTSGGKLLYPYIEALRLALKERNDVISGSWPTILNTEYSDVSVRSDGLAHSDWGIAFDDKVDDIITPYISPYGDVVAYIDYASADSNGQWNGDTEHPPVMTEARMLSLLGDPAILKVGAETRFSALWADQMYRLINHLVWVIHFYDAHGIFTASYDDGGNNVKTGSGNDTDVAASKVLGEAEYNDPTQWGFTGFNTQINVTNAIEREAQDPPNYRTLPESEEFQIGGSDYGTIGGDAADTKDVSFYIWLEAPNDTALPGYTLYEWDDFGEGWIEGSYNFIVEETYSGTNSFITTDRYFGSQPWPTWVTTPVEDDTKTIRGYVCDSGSKFGFIVAKLNVESGFSYQ